MENARILVINPGSTSTKLGLFEGGRCLVEEKIAHPVEELARVGPVINQLEFRLDVIRDFLRRHDTAVEDLAAVAARGGLLRPLQGGTYRVNGKMLEDLRSCRMGEHASNLGALLAHALTRDTDVPAFIVDPVVVDEMEEKAKVTGVPGIRRRSIFHALNQKAAAREAARMLGKRYEEVNLVVAHLGGGISVGAHRRGRVVDVNDALYGDGPMGPERAGKLPPYAFLRYVQDRGMDDRAVRRLLAGGGGVVAHLDTNDMEDVVARMRRGEARAARVFDALVYQVAKEIGALAAALQGAVDGVVITGGLARSEACVEKLKDYVSFIAPVFVIPGERELEALAAGALRVLAGEEEAREY